LRADPVDGLVVAYADVVDDGENDAEDGNAKEHNPVQ
jgi:hypothetical protein